MNLKGGKKRLTVFLLITVLVTALLPVTAFADGAVNHDVYWNIEYDGSGSGKILKLGPTYQSVGYDEEPDEGYCYSEEEQADYDAYPEWYDTYSFSAVEICGTIRPVSTNCWFSNSEYQFSDLTSLDLTGVDTSYCTDMSGMFYSCNYLKSINFGNSFDTSNVTNMEYMFYYCAKLRRLDLSGFDTSKVTSMKEMFEYCYALTGLDLSSFNTSNVESFYEMFYDCYALRKLDLTSFDTSKTKDMYCMFCYCYSLKELDLSGFDMSVVEDAEYMFYGCYGLDTIYTGCRQDWSKLGFDDSELFDECYGLKGGEGTDYDAYEESVSVSYKALARVDGLDGKPGLFTAKHQWDKGTVTKAATTTSTGVKTYKCTVCGAARTETIPKVQPAPAKTKKANTLTAKGRKVSLKAKKLKKKAQVIKPAKAYTVKKPCGKVTYKKVSVGSKKINKKYGKKFVVNTKTGKITVKKRVKKGTYKLKVKVKAAGNSTYKAATKTVTVTIRVK